MKTISVKFENGEFYRIGTGERVIFQNGVEYVLIAHDNVPWSFEADAPIRAALSKEDQIQKYIDNSDVDYLAEMLNRGQILYFDINDRNGGSKSVFKVELLEDLFMFSKYDYKKKDPKLSNSLCRLIAINNKKLDGAKIIHAESLNEMYKKVFVIHRGNQGNPTCNAFSKYYYYSSENDASMKFLFMNRDTNLANDQSNIITR